MRTVGWSQMCIGPCDAWQPRDPVSKLPILEPVWRYLVCQVTLMQQSALIGRFRACCWQLTKWLCVAGWQLTNQEPPSSNALAFQALGNLRNYTPPCQHSAMDDNAFLLVSSGSTLGSAGEAAGYPKPSIQPSCCNRNCQANCKNCLQADGTCAIC
jgi:hypothetical protein